jgi:hypothetical protein
MMEENILVTKICLFKWCNLDLPEAKQLEELMQHQLPADKVIKVKPAQRLTQGTASNFSLSDDVR